MMDEKFNHILSLLEAILDLESMFFVNGRAETFNKRNFSFISNLEICLSENYQYFLLNNFYNNLTNSFLKQRNQQASQLSQLKTQINSSKEIIFTRKSQLSELKERLSQETNKVLLFLCFEKNRTFFYVKIYLISLFSCSCQYVKQHLRQKSKRF